MAIKMYMRLFCLLEVDLAEVLFGGGRQKSFRKHNLGDSVETAWAIFGVPSSIVQEEHRTNYGSA